MTNLDGCRRNLLEICSIKTVFLSNDREEFKLSYDVKIIDLKSPRSLENILKFAET